ncbi:LCP family protein [Candidatus Peregrinibacteria bacterium]|nr:LCP family protein [Candidatus Peregrinibacteria bacterium]
MDSMDFKTRKIRKHSPKPPRERKPLPPHLKMQLFAVFGGIAMVGLLLFGIFEVIKSLNFSSIIFSSFGKNLQTSENGKTNILLTGTGGANHDGGNLTDTVMLVNIDYKTKTVPMLSIPRDLYVETKLTGRSRINEVYNLAKKKYGDKQGLDVLKDTVSQLTGQDIQYVIKVDFDGFVKIVDALGGVDVVVENDIYDPYYPKGETIQYQTFSIKAGPQHLDGETALKYARSRKTTSDFDRAKRQQQLLFAIKEKALSMNVLTDPTKIQSLYNSVAGSIDTNLNLGEIVELAKIAQEFGKESAVPLVLNDDPTSCGGMLYTPSRDFFGGASVLLPAGGGYDYIHMFVNTEFNNMSVLREVENNKIQILNATKTPGLALEGMNLLSRFCLNVVYYGNAVDRTKEISTIYYRPKPLPLDKDGKEIPVDPKDENASEERKPEVLKVITTLMPDIQVVEGIPAEYLEDDRRIDSAVVVELGKDYLTKRIKDPYDNLRYLETTPVSKPKTSSQQSTQQ